MYAIIDGLCFLAGLGFFVACFVDQEHLEPIYSLIGVGWIILYPIINEVIYNIFASACSDRVVYDVGLKSRFVYHPNYNLTFCGLEKLHPFDSEKYSFVFNTLLEKGVIKSEDDAITPSKIPRSLLLERVSKIHLLKICYSIGVCACLEMPFCFMPGFLLRWRVLDPMLLGTEGTILASVAATKFKWAVNISGGYHHANCEAGGGFCIYPDITLALHYMRTRMGINKAMIIDLDAHQGNGHERDHLHDDNTFIVDAYNHRIYPGDYEAREAIRLDIDVRSNTDDEEYLKKISVISR